MPTTNWRRALAAARIAAIVLACMLGLFINVRLWFDAGHGGVDFNQFYSASKLAGTGHLYDWDSLRALESQHGPPIHSGRLPVVTYGVKPLTLLPYTAALWMWRAASMAALAAVCFIWPGAKRWLLLLAFAWSGPATYTIALGQDTAFWLLFFTLGIALLDRGRAQLAGLVFALCLCKYHLAVALPVFLIAQSRWKTLIAGALSIAALIAASFAIEGPGWPREYIRTVSLPDFSPGVRDMPNLNGLASWFAGAGWVEVGASLVCVWLLWLVSRRAPPTAFAGAATAACGLLLSHHAYVGDCLVLVPLSALVLQSSAFPLWLRGWAVIVATPLLMFAVVSRTTYVGQAAAAGFVLAAMGVALWNGRRHIQPSLSI